LKIVGQQTGLWRRGQRGSSKKEVKAVFKIGGEPGDNRKESTPCKGGQCLNIITKKP